MFEADLANDKASAEKLVGMIRRFAHDPSPEPEADVEERLTVAAWASAPRISAAHAAMVLARADADGRA